MLDAKKPKRTDHQHAPGSVAKLADAAVRASGVGGCVKSQDDSKALTFFFDLGKRLQRAGKPR